MSVLRAILGLLTFWSRLSSKYGKICSEGKQQQSVYFGVRAIASVIIGIILTVLCGVGAYYVATALMDTLLIIFAIIIVIALVIAALLAFANGVIGALLCVIYQLRLNRKAIGWVALAIWLIFLIAGIVAAVYILQNF